MIWHSEISDKDLSQLINAKLIQFGGNAKLKIYGSLACRSGKRMKRENRVFFLNEKEALKEGYRPCGNCMNEKYKEWIFLNK